MKSIFVSYVNNNCFKFYLPWFWQDSQITIWQVDWNKVDQMWTKAVTHSEKNWKIMCVFIQLLPACDNIKRLKIVLLLARVLSFFFYSELQFTSEIYLLLDLKNPGNSPAGRCFQRYATTLDVPAVLQTLLIKQCRSINGRLPTLHAQMALCVSVTWSLTVYL